MCELNSTVRPCSPIERSRSISCSRWRGSMPLNGSSSSSTGGSWTSAVAILIRCFIPFEYVEMSRSWGSVICTVSSARRAASSGSSSRCSRALASTNSQPDTDSYMASRSGTSPIRR